MNLFVVCFAHECDNVDAVSQLKNGDSSLNVVEIIFKTSWVQQQKQQQTKKDHESSTTAPAAAAAPICSSSTTSATAAGPAPKIERILKIENKETAIHEFEEYRNKVKERSAPATAAAHDHHYSSYNNNNNSSSRRDHLAGMNMIGKSRKKNTVPVILLQQQGGSGSGAAADQRCVTDGNELLRFFATSLSCCLGDNGCTNLCSLPDCNVCNIIRWGFVNQRGKGIYTTATSGRAHQDFISKQEPENLQLLELQDQQQHEQQQQQPPPPQQKNLIKTRNFLSTHLGKCKNKTHEMKMKLMLKMKKKKKQLQPEQYGMFVCRVIAGHIQKLASDQKLPALPAFSLLPQGYDSVAQEYCSSLGAAGSPSSSSSSSSSSTVSAHLDDLFVFDSKAVLPCFLVVYTI